MHQSMEEKRIYLIDATAFCYRAFYAVSGLSTSFGQPTNAVYGFLNMFHKVLKENNPEYLAVCFDVSRDTFRQKKFAEYKIQRPPMPDGLSSQIPLIKQIVSAYGIVILEKEGFEADDIIATLAAKGKQKGYVITVISSDKDMLQLVDEHTAVFSPYKNEGVLYNEAKVLERYGVNAGQIADIIALMGDDVDNIPGVKGIGEKTASELIKSFGSIENLRENLDKVKQEKLQKTLRENFRNIELSKDLAVLDRQVDIELDFKKIKVGNPDYTELTRIFRHLEFKSLLKEIPQAESKEAPADLKIEEIKDSELGSLAGSVRELYLAAADLHNPVFFFQGKVFQVVNPGKNSAAVLADSRIKKIGHNLKELKVALHREGVELTGLHFDLMIAAHLINPSGAGYGLSDIAWNFLEKNLSSGDLSDAAALDLMVRLKPELEKQLKEKELYSLFMDLEMPLAEVLAEMEAKGIKLDKQVLRDISDKLKKKLEKLVKEIYLLSETEFNINSPKQLRQILFEKLKLPVVKRNKTGPSTDEEVLRKLAKTHKLPELLLEYRQLIKLKNTYVDTLPDLADRQDRIHTSFNQTATETGRLSSTNPNLQNIPIKTEIGSSIRKAIIASAKNNFLLSCDYSQIELRILAHISKDEQLISAFKQDKDIHRITAALVHGVKETQVTDSMREVAKRINFGIIYGLSSFGLSRDLEITFEEAQNFIDAYFIRYPGVKLYIEKQIKQAERDGFVTTILNRRRYLPEIKSKNQAIRQMAQRQAVNTPIQGSASDLIKLAMIHIHREIKDKNLQIAMLLQIHDELVFEVAEGEIEASLALIRKHMEGVMKLVVPIRVSIKKGKNWLEMEEVE